MIEIFRCADALPFQELETRWTTHWQERSSTPFFSGMPSPLAWNCLKKNDSFCSRTIGLDIQWHCAMPVWSPGKAKSTDMRGFPLTVSRHQAHQTSLGIFQKAITKSYSNLTSTQMSLNYLDSYFQKLV